MIRHAFALAACLAGPGSLPAAELVTLTPGNAAAVAPAGKEADWIHGDHVLRDERIVAVIARPVASRQANMTVRSVGGCLIDLTSRERLNDQLSCYYPASGLAEFRAATAAADGVSPMAGDDLTVTGSRVRLEAVSEAAAARPAITAAYELADGDDFLTVTATWSNPGSTAVPVSVADRVRADRTFTSAGAAGDNVAWWDDAWFGQTYVVVPLGAGFKPGKPDAVSTAITVAAGVETPLAARLVRVVDTSGWISSDFHSHSTPSGDNTSSQLGRVQNLLAEQIEFGPCPWTGCGPAT